VREDDYSSFHNSFIAVLILLLPLSLGYPKTTRRFAKNKPSFCEKQAVVLRKTSRRFAKNKPSFCEKQAIGSSNTHLNRKETSDASQETSDIFL